MNKIYNFKYHELLKSFNCFENTQYDNYIIRLRPLIEDMNHRIVCKKQRLLEKKELEEEAYIWEESKSLNTKESYEYYLEKYDYGLYWEEAQNVLKNIYSKEILSMNYENFPKAKEYINNEFKCDNYGLIKDLYPEWIKTIDLIQKSNIIINSKEFLKLPEVKNTLLYTASITHGLPNIKPDYEDFKKLYDNIKKLLSLIEIFKKHDQYTQNYKKIYIANIFLNCNNSNSSHSYPEGRIEKEVEKLEYKISFSLKGCDDEKINFDIVEKEIEKFNNIEEGSYYDSFLKIGKLLYLAECVSFELENTPNPLLNLLNPFHTIKVYIGTLGIMTYNEKFVSYNNIECLLYNDYDISNLIEEHKYLNKLDIKCKNKILEAVKLKDNVK